MSFVRVCSKADVPVGSLMLVKAGNKDLVLANVDGTLFAMDNSCTHEQGNLSQGELTNNIVTCPDHGAQFNVKTGQVILGPDGESPDTIQPERTYKVKVQGEDILVEVS